MAGLQERGRQDVDTELEDRDPVASSMSSNFQWVLPAISEILRENPQLTYTAGDVYAACESGAATLWTTKDGLVVTTGETDTFTGDRTMLIWIAWAWERGTNLVTKHQDFFIELARNGGYKKLEVRSAVPELKAYILSQGWQVDTIVYTRDIK
jgi:hypothetical protein